MGLRSAYVIWLALLTGDGAVLARGKNAPYFQFRSSGASADEARRLAAEAGQELYPAASGMATLIVSSRNWKTWALVVLYFTTFGGFIALTAWLPTYWQELHGTSLLVAGLRARRCIRSSPRRSASTAASWPTGSGGERTALISLTVLLVGAVGMAVSSNLYGSVLAEVLMAVGSGNAAVFKLVPRTSSGRRSR